MLTVDPLVQHLLNGGNARWRARNFDEHIGTIDGAKQPARLLHGAKRIMGQIRRDFQTHKAIDPSRGVVHRSQDVTGVLHVRDHEVFIDGRGLSPPPPPAA